MKKILWGMLILTLSLVPPAFAQVERDDRNADGDRMLAGRLLDGSGETFLLVDHPGELAGDVIVSAAETGAGEPETRAVPAGATSLPRLSPIVGPPIQNDPPTVTIEATAPDAYEAGNVKGIFTIRRTMTDEVGELPPLVVGYRVGGTALGGVRYRALPGIVTIPGGALEARVKVKPLDDGATGGGDSTVKVTLEPGDGYQLGTLVKAKVKVHDAPAP